MKPKLFFLCVFALFAVHSFSYTYHIKQDGTGNYTTIQEGINASADSDTVLVYPGTYYENINYNGKSITVGSLNLTTGNEQYITQTIIDGNFSGSCVRMEYVQDGAIHGFTIQHGSGIQPNPYDYFYGGGLYLNNTNSLIFNCFILNNETEIGGGISLANSDVFISNSKITCNHAIHSTGGICIGVNSILTFDENNLCDVYLNTSPWPNDIFYANLDQNIIVDTFTVIDPDVHFINNATHTSIYTFSAQNSVIEPIESDLYVAPWGDNNNSGLNETEPLQSIALALTKIKADSLHPRTIHLADGVYSTFSNDQRFPLNLKSYVSLIGESEEGTSLDGDGAYGFMAAFDEEKEITLKNFTCQNGFLRLNDNLVWFYYNTSTSVEDITIKDCISSEGTTRALELPEGSVSRNITIDNVMGAQSLTLYPVNISLENITIANALPNSGNGSGGALLITNNCLASGNPVTIKNLKVVNNVNNEDEWDSSASIAITDLADVVFMNATIASNTNMPGYGGAITLNSGKLTLINSIVYGNYPHQICLDSNSVYGPCELTVINSLIEDGIDGFYITGDYELNWLTGNIDADPLFIDDDEDFHLQDGSPCIGAGIDAVEIDGTWYYAPEYDIEGNPRPNPFDSMPDLGAYENQCGIPQVEVEEGIIEAPTETMISNFPNPFNPSTTIKLELADSGKIELAIYNIKGQKVKTLLNCTTAPGTYECNWNGKDELGKSVSSGQYLVKLKQNEKETAKKIMLLK